MSAIAPSGWASGADPRTVVAARRARAAPCSRQAARMPTFRQNVAMALPVRSWSGWRASRKSQSLKSVARRVQRRRPWHALGKGGVERRSWRRHLRQARVRAPRGMPVQRTQPCCAGHGPRSIQGGVREREIGTLLVLQSASSPAPTGRQGASWGTAAAASVRPPRFFAFYWGGWAARQCFSMISWARCSSLRLFLTNCE